MKPAGSPTLLVCLGLYGSLSLGQTAGQEQPNPCADPQATATQRISFEGFRASAVLRVLGARFGVDPATIDYDPETTLTTASIPDCEKDAVERLLLCAQRTAASVDPLKEGVSAWSCRYSPELGIRRYGQFTRLIRRGDTTKQTEVVQLADQSEEIVLLLVGPDTVVRLLAEVEELLREPLGSESSVSTDDSGTEGESEAAEAVAPLRCAVCGKEIDRAKAFRYVPPRLPRREFYACCSKHRIEIIKKLSESGAGD